MQTLHRARDRAVGDRTSLMNQLRAVLLERGIIVPQGRAKLRLRVTELLRQSAGEISSRIRLLIEDMLMRWQAIDERIAVFDGEFAAEAKRDEAARRLTSIPGIGALNATALVAAVGNAQTFARGRNLAAGLGLVPRQATTGGMPRLLGITKRGSKYLWKMLIQGARAALPLEPKQHPPRSMAARSARESLIPIRSLSRSPPRWRAPSGHSCGTAQRLNREQSLVDSAMVGSRYQPVNDVCEWLREDGLTVDRRSANLRRKMTPRCRPPYEDWNARISILANGITERPDTFVQTVYASAKTTCRRGRPYVSTRRRRAVCFHVRGVDHLRVRGSSVPSKFPEQVFPDAAPRPAQSGYRSLSQDHTRAGNRTSDSRSSGRARCR